MRRTFFFLLFNISLCMMATCPQRGFYKYKQLNGDFVTVQRYGNDYGYYFKNLRGDILLPNEKGELCYAVSGRNAIKNTNIVAKDGDQYVSSKSLNKYCENKILNHISSFKENGLFVSDSPNGIVNYGERGPGIISSIGHCRIPVVLVEFKDEHLQFSQDKFNRFFNEKGYHDENHTIGSVKDYFTTQSNQLFEPQFDLLGLVKLDHEYSYYGQNSDFRIDIRMEDFRSEALRKIIENGTDVSPYEDKGKVPLVIFIHAGIGEESYGSQTNYMYSQFRMHETTISNKTFSSYLIAAELKAPKTFNGMGVLCHEIGHALGLPDFYDTTRGGNKKTLDLWSVMDYGQYAYNSYRPVGLNGFEKATLGWIQVDKLNENNIKSSLIDTAHISILENSNNPQKFFVLEYRKPYKYYSSLMGQGLLITHVNYIKDAWRTNSVNTNKILGFIQIPADSTYTDYDKLINAEVFRKAYQGDLFGHLNHYEFSNEKYKNLLYEVCGDSLNFSLENIMIDGGGKYVSFEKIITNILPTEIQSHKHMTQYYNLQGELIQNIKESGIYIKRVAGKSELFYYRKE